MMNSITFRDIMDHRRWIFHLSVALFSFLISVTFVLLGQITTGFSFARISILLFVQLEVFLMIARMIFTELKPGISVSELTRTVLSRFFIFMVLCFIAALLINMIFLGLTDLLYNRDSGGSIRNFFSYEFGGWTKSTMTGLMIGAAIFIIIQWQDALRREQKLREENLIFQNQTLKNQVNPHFLFNSLNTLSALIPEHPDSAERFILKLSSIYRYILENSTKNFVPLESELGFISDYYYLHSIRGDDKIQLTVDAPGAGKYQVLPVSLQILVENAIKHNTATRENPLKIKISIEDDILVVRNNLQKMPSIIKSTGIGLNNLKERMRLSTGKSLVFEEKQNEFIVKIPLKI